jgi:hypothetical protein
MPDLLDPRTAAVVAALGFIVIGGFQAALALGAPLGRAAWGGGSDELSPRLRTGSAIAVVVWLVAILLVLARADYLSLPGPAELVTWGAWALVVLLVLGAVMNMASSSLWERFGWGPLAAILAAFTAIVALGPA